MLWFISLWILLSEIHGILEVSNCDLIKLANISGHIWDLIPNAQMAEFHTPTPQNSIPEELCNSVSSLELQIHRKSWYRIYR